MDSDALIAARHQALEGVLDERQWRLHAATFRWASCSRTWGYSLQGNRKKLEGASHPDRNAQFEYINDKTQAALGAGQPVISVDTKKKELVGRYQNGGKEWMPQGKPEPVKVYDFVDEAMGRVNPYAAIRIARDYFHGEWNYVISPNR